MRIWYYLKDQQDPIVDVTRDIVPRVGDEMKFGMDGEVFVVDTVRWIENTTKGSPYNFPEVEILLTNDKPTWQNFRRRRGSA